MTGGAADDGVSEKIRAGAPGYQKFIKWCAKGSSIDPQRRELFIRQKETVEAEIGALEKILDILRFKFWYYEQAIPAGNCRNNKKEGKEQSYVF